MPNDLEKCYWKRRQPQLLQVPKGNHSNFPDLPAETVELEQKEGEMPPHINHTKSGSAAVVGEEHAETTRELKPRSHMQITLLQEN